MDDERRRDRWTAHLDARGVVRSGVVTAIRSWLVALEDPDGDRPRLHSLEDHGPELRPDEENPWVTGQAPAGHVPAGEPCGGRRAASVSTGGGLS